MKKLVCFAAALVMLIVGAGAAFSQTAKEDSKLVGTWNLTTPSVNSEGIACPFVPEKMVFQKNQTVIMSNVPDQPLPYKTVLSEKERAAFESRASCLSGMPILLIKVNPAMEWISTPMAYGYHIEKDELTLVLQGWSPAKFKREKK